MGQKCAVLYKKTSVGFIVAGDTNSPQNRSLQVKQCWALKGNEEIEIKKKYFKLNNNKRKKCGVSVATLLLFIMLTAKYVDKRSNNPIVLISLCSAFVAISLAFV
jgi:hypothetical protein